MVTKIDPIPKAARPNRMRGNFTNFFSSSSKSWLTERPPNILSYTTTALDFNLSWTFYAKIPLHTYSTTTVEVALTFTNVTLNFTTPLNESSAMSYGTHYIL